MRFSEIELPSNKKFGFFFTFIFTALAIYFLLIHSFLWGQTFVILAALFFLITITNPRALSLFNKLWLQFGLLLGMVMNPILLGIIFFGLVTPYAVVMRILGRDELHLLKKITKTNWKNRSQNMPQTDFTQQF